MSEISTRSSRSNPTDMGVDPISASHFIDAPVADVWRAWTSPEMMAEWMAPAPVRAKVHAFEPHPGGAFVLSMVMPDDTHYTSHACVLAFDVNERVVFTDMLGPGFVPAQGGSYTSVISFSPEGDGTRCCTDVYYQYPEVRNLHIRTGVMESWGQAAIVLARLARALADGRGA